MTATAAAAAAKMMMVSTYMCLITRAYAEGPCRQKKEVIECLGFGVSTLHHTLQFAGFESLQFVVIFFFGAPLRLVPIDYSKRTSKCTRYE